MWLTFRFHENEKEALKREQVRDKRKVQNVGSGEHSSLTSLTPNHRCVFSWKKSELGLLILGPRAGVLTAHVGTIGKSHLGRNCLMEITCAMWCQLFNLATWLANSILLIHKIQFQDHRKIECKVQRVPIYLCPSTSPNVNILANSSFFQ